jgi:hypothetical protein
MEHLTISDYNQFGIPGGLAAMIMEQIKNKK